MKLFYSFLSKLNFIRHITSHSYETYKVQKKLRNEKVFIHPDVKLISSLVENEVKIFGPGRIYKSEISRFTYIQYNSNIGYTKIGPFCSIGPNFISGMGNHPLDKISTHPIFYDSHNPWDLFLGENNDFNPNRATNIGADTWIGANVFIKEGLNIGNGVIIGAGSVVLNDIPDFAIYAGVPAKLIRMRFNDSIIQKLLEDKWWNKDVKYIKSYLLNFKN